MGLRLLPGVAVVVGFGLVEAGAWLVYPPVAFLVGGAALLAVGLVVDVGK